MIDHLILKRYCGTEIFRVADAKVRQVGLPGALGWQFEACTDPTPVKTLPDTEELFARPNIEVALTISEREIGGPSGYRLKELCLGYPARFYYVEHDALRGVEVSLAEIEPSRMRARLIGFTTDFCVYDGSVPDTQVELEAWFVKVGAWPDV